MESRIAELTARVDVQSQSLAEMYTQSHAEPRLPRRPRRLSSPRSRRLRRNRPASRSRPLANPAWCETPRFADAAHQAGCLRTACTGLAGLHRANGKPSWAGIWLNKIGVFVLVVGLALLLRYSFTQFGPVGRVTICLAASLALLAAGVIFESKERYRIFARGLLGGGLGGALCHGLRHARGRVGAE